MWEGGGVAGLVPGLRVTATRVHEILKDESRGSSSLRIGRLSRFLVISELAFSVGLLVSAGLMVKGMLRLRTLDYGFRTEEVFTARIGLFENDFPTPEWPTRMLMRSESQEASSSIPTPAVALVKSRG